MKSQQLSIVPPAIDFGTIETEATATQILVLTNVENTVLQITEFQKSGSPNFFLDPESPEQACGSERPTLDPGESCQIAVNFSPSGPEPVTASLAFASQNPPATFFVELSGNGTSESCSLGNAPFSPGFLLLWILPILLFYFWGRTAK